MASDIEARLTALEKKVQRYRDEREIQEIMSRQVYLPEDRECLCLRRVSTNKPTTTAMR